MPADLRSLGFHDGVERWQWLSLLVPSFKGPEARLERAPIFVFGIPPAERLSQAVRSVLSQPACAVNGPKHGDLIHQIGEAAMTFRENPRTECLPQAWRGRCDL